MSVRLYFAHLANVCCFLAIAYCLFQQRQPHAVIAALSLVGLVIVIAGFLLDGAPFIKALLALWALFYGICLFGVVGAGLVGAAP